MSKASTYQRRARDFAQRENWDGALAELRQALSTDGNNPMLHNQMGDLFLRKEDVVQACTHFEKAVDLYSDLGLHNNAVALCRKVIRLCPSRLEVRFRLARLRVDQELLSEATASFADYLEHLPVQSDAEVRTLEARCREIVESFPAAAPIAKLLEKLEEARAFAAAFELVQRLAQRAADAGDDDTARRYTTKMRSLQVLVEGRGGDLPGRPSAPPSKSARVSRKAADGAPSRPSWVDPSNLAMPAPVPASAPHATPLSETALDAAPAGAVASTPGAEVPELDLDAALPSASAPEIALDEPVTAVREYDLDAALPSASAPEVAMDGPETAVREYDLDVQAPESSLPEFDLDVQAPESSVREFDLDVEMPGAALPEDELVARATPVSLPELDLEGDPFGRSTGMPGASATEPPRSRAAEPAASQEYELHESSLADIAAFWNAERSETRVHPARAPAVASQPVDAPSRADAGRRGAAPATGVGPAAFEPEPAPPAWPQEGGDDDLGRTQPTAAPRAAAPPSLRETVWVPDPSCTDPAISEPREGGSVHELADVIDTFRKQMALALGDDAAARYDLGVAYYEMGLYDEALDEFDVARTNVALRERSLEMMAACMGMQGRHAEILTLLAPVLQTQDDPSLDLGLRYCMGVACEALGRRSEARRHFEAVARVDSSYRDVGMRLQRF